MVKQEYGKKVWKEIAGWLLCIIVPLLVYFFVQRTGLRRESAIFAAIISVALIMWILELLPDFVPGLFALLLCMLFGLAPRETIMSGFSSEGFFMAISVLGLGAVIVTSGLSYRYALWMMKLMPANTFSYMAGLFITGLVLTPLVPVISGRAAIVAPVLKEVVKHSYEGVTMDEALKERSLTALFTSSLGGITFLSAMFLSSTPLNIIIYGMLPLQEQQSFQFLKWFSASSLAALVMVLCYVILCACYFRTFHALNIDKSFIQARLAEMGPLKPAEWLALAGIILLALGMFASAVTKISVPWVSFGVLFLLLYVGALTTEDFRIKLDWPFLFLLGSMIGLVETMNYLKLDEAIARQLAWLATYMTTSFPQFVALFTVTMILLRIVIPMNAAVLIFAATLLPLANASGMSSWVIGFLILLMAETALFPFQAPYLSNFRNTTRDLLHPREPSVTIINFFLIFAKLAAVYVSIPFWIKTGVL